MNKYKKLLTSLTLGITIPFLQPQPKEDQFQLLGTGIRKVTFLYIPVYKINIYIKSINGDTIGKDVVVGKGDAIGNAVMESIGKHDFVIEIIPERQTDLTHLRNGFIRMVTAKYNLISDDLNDEERMEIKHKLDEFKGIFPSRMTIKKGEVLRIEKDRDSLKCSFKDTILGIGEINDRH